MTSNRNDLQVALEAIQEEKRMIERELLTLRAQLKGQSKMSTMMQVGQDDIASVKSASLRHMHHESRQGFSETRTGPLTSVEKPHLRYSD